MDFVMCITPQLERTDLLLFISLTGVSMAPKRAGQAEHIHLQPRWDLWEEADSAHQKWDRYTYYTSGWNPAFNALILIPKQEAGEMRGEWGLRGDRHELWRAAGEMGANDAFHNRGVNASAGPADVMQWQRRSTGPTNFMNEPIYSGKSKPRK